MISVQELLLGSQESWGANTNMPPILCAEMRDRR